MIRHISGFAGFVELFVITMLATSAVAASEPPWCQPAEFMRHEIRSPVGGQLVRLRMFQLGPVTLAGLAVGASNVQDVAHLAATWGAQADDSWCTWFWNDGNPAAEKAFHHHTLPNPGKVSIDEAVRSFREGMEPALSGNGRGSILACMTDHRFVASGCFLQKHRGPTVFGALLAFSGCRPEQAADIVNALWGLNGVPAVNRLAVIRMGAELGDRHPAERAQMQRLFSARTPARLR